MGMYDQIPNFEDNFNVGDRMVLCDLQYEGTIPTVHGQAERSTVRVRTRTGEATYSALGVGFANLAKRATSEDFPHVAEYVRIDLKGDKTLKLFAPVQVGIEAWLNGDDGPPLSDSPQ